MSENNKIQIVIDNKKLTLVGPDSQEYMMRVAEFIDKKINEVRNNEGTKYLNQTLTLTLAAINIADTYLKEIAERVKITEIAKQKGIQIEQYKSVITALRKENINSIDLRTYLNEVDEKSTEENDLNDKLNSAIEENNQLKLKVEQLENENKSITKRLNITLGDNIKSETVFAITEKYKAIEDENNAIKVNCNSLELKAKDLEEQLAFMKTEKEKTEQLLSSVQKEKIELLASLDIINVQKKVDTEGNVEEQCQDITSIVQELEETKHKNMELEGLLKEAQAKHIQTQTNFNRASAYGHTNKKKHKK